MSTVTRYLVLRADRSMRLLNRPHLRWDEVAIRIRVTYPDNWGRVISDLDLNAPEFAPDVAAVIEREQP